MRQEVPERNYEAGGILSNNKEFTFLLYHWWCKNVKFVLRVVPEQRLLSYQNEKSFPVLNKNSVKVNFVGLLQVL